VPKEVKVLPNDVVETLRKNLPGAKAAPAVNPYAGPVNVPKVGEVIQGYRFKGGNPADKNNWEPE
jgi:hypothetical protein